MKKDFEELRKRAYAYKWGSFEKKNWSDWGLLFRFLVLICELLSNSKTKPKRKPNAWAIFAGEQIRAGKTIKEAAKMWKLNK